ncbi:MAG: hypothetical protein KDJ47_07570 [Hyphomicrobiaceae bacterium]|nr:hypothetical protein [Hyphomicrobiaceae bacterium]
MVAEPYPFADDYLENPSLFVSSDGVSWAVPTGVSNPIVAEPERRGSWHSDGDLILHGDSALYLYYRFNSGAGETTCLLTRSEDGIRWTQPEPLFQFQVSGRFASPAVIERGSRYSMFFVDTIARTVRVRHSPDGRRWFEESEVLQFPGAWHLDAISWEGRIYLLLNASKALFLLRSLDLETWEILSADGWRRFARPAEAVSGRAGSSWLPLLAPSGHGWDDQEIYRSTFLIEDGEIRLWYGAKSSGNQWNVGYISGQLPS